MSIRFAQLGLPKPLVRKLEQQGITETFPVQAATIPDALAGRDVSGKAPTGSGKTLAFGLPLLARIDKASPKRPKALILAPTRELAEQIKQDLVPLARSINRYVFAVYGGVGYRFQINALRKGVDVLVATPGRLEDLLDQRAVDLRNAEFVVVDEADRMADMGFLPAVRRILDKTAHKRQTMLFSATLDGDIAVLSRDYQTKPVRHEAPAIEPRDIDATHHFWLVEHDERIKTAADVIAASGRSIVFTRTRHGADRLAKQLAKMSVGAVAMHGGRSQTQRQRALKAFSAGDAQALIATDVAARGIHIDAVASVVHFDPPADHKDYLHRSGRTARAGATGTIVSLVTHQQRRAVQRLQNELDLRLPIERPRLDSLNVPGDRIPRKAAPTAPSRPRRDPEATTDRRPGPGRDDSTPKRRAVVRDRSASAIERAPSVYVANLPWDATEEDVADLFGRYGHVQQATVIVDKRTGRSKGFGFVDMPREAAEKAIGQLHGALMDGRDLTVRFAQPRKWGG